MKFFLAAFSMLMVISCNTTPSDLSRNSNSDANIVINENYELVYARIKQYTLRCFEFQFITGGSKIHSDIFSHSKTARIGYSVSGLIGNVPYFDIKINAENEKKDPSNHLSRGNYASSGFVSD